jgi:hypothetical protein
MELERKVKHALDETRILVLGAQVLLGFEFRGSLERGFDELPRGWQHVKLVGLVLLLVTTALLMAPASYHRLVENGQDTRGVHRFTTSVTGIALLPFALALGIEVAIPVYRVAGTWGAVSAAAIAALVALGLWYGLELVVHRPRSGRGGEMEDKEEPTPLKDRIDHVLTEARVVLPGAQALLGFQLASTLIDGFTRLPRSSQWVHLASLGCITLATVFLMTPSAYHRLVDLGEDTERFHGFASLMVLLAMIPLAFGIGGDVFVVVRKVLQSTGVAVAVAGISLALFYGLWFGLTGWVRASRSAAARARTEPRVT